ncbi:hypothetical protein G3A56_05340 [Rhizobium oryzihabitans]|uniref:Uncharacterized protein n=1 Tax=Rhizobium oryzihabitans TaxID=2267833 RepID=A0A7L5BF79_9HYPH|nr:hypothetical protein [Rhizobium oryzihabitans]QIB37482.1 hypothetical protein G3A56_05340 [Rhizobium oryzihabitans]
MEEAVCGRKSPERTNVFHKRLQYRRENRNGFRKPQCVLQAKEHPFQRPAGEHRTAGGGLRRGRNRDGKTAAAIYAS